MSYQQKRFLSINVNAPTMTTYRGKQIKTAEKEVIECLHRSGIVRDSGTGRRPPRLHLDYKPGNNDEIGHIRLLAAALLRLAEVLEQPVTRNVAPTRRRALNQLASLYGSDKGTSYFHRHGYTRVYEQIFAALRDKPITLLEIGLNIHSQSHDESNWYTPSLHVWRDYFPKARLYGLDIAPYRPSQIKDCVLLQADQSDAADLDRATKGLSFDVVIDDGSHVSAHQQITLATLFPKVRPGGYYILEDLHFQPSFDRQRTCKTQALLRMLQRKCSLPPQHALTPSALAYLERTIDQIMFFDSLSPNFLPTQTVDALCVIQKKQAMENAHARRKKTKKHRI